jgi:ribosomal protein L29
MDIKELRQKTDKELADLAASLRESLRNFRFEVAADAVKNVRAIRDAKKTLSRTLLLLGEKAKAAKKTVIAK